MCHSSSATPVIATSKTPPGWRSFEMSLADHRTGSSCAARSAALPHASARTTKMKTRRAAGRAIIRSLARCPVREKRFDLQLEGPLLARAADDAWLEHDPPVPVHEQVGREPARAVGFLGPVGIGFERVEREP